MPSVRSPGGQRRYPRSSLRRIAFIRAAQNVGLSLDEIRDALAELPAGRPPSADDWARLSGSWRGRLDEQIEDAAARSGSGARFLPAPLRRPHGAPAAGEEPSRTLPRPPRDRVR